MAQRKTWRERLGAIFSNRRERAHEILAERYVAASRQAQRVSHYAERMQYPQFREKLRAIAADESEHAQWIAEKLRSLESAPPEVPEISLGDKSNWEYLRAELEEHRRCAAELPAEISLLREEMPAVADTLQRIYEGEARHREAIRAMLMRSDPQAHLAV